ncbi:L-dopachrome tautomerase-related protein [Hymenobacter jeollabukensis]|nr:L-dopachrome tautomerase-related protein [Hymenobacter jeollabukensis]
MERNTEQTPAAHPTVGPLEAVYQGPTPWVGIVVSDAGRAFVLYPRPAGEAGPRIAELRNGQPEPYPSAAWNDWQPGAPTAGKFVRANSLRIGPDGLLWVVDTGTAQMGGPVLPGGPKLVAIDLQTNQVVRTLPLTDVLKPNSFVDDLRLAGNTIYLTDAGVPALIVLDKQTGRGRRVLENDASTTARRPLYAEGTALTTPAGQPVRVHADQLEVSPDGRLLYFQTASGPLYRIETRYLLNPQLPAAELSRHVQLFFDTPSTGGTAIDAAGNLYVADANHQRILKITPDAQATTLLEDKHLLWPDALWIDNHGNLWIPAAQLNRLARLHGGVDAFQPPVFIYKLPIGAEPFRS